MNTLRLVPWVGLAALVSMAACSTDESGPALPQAPGLYTLRGHVRVTGFLVNDQGTFTGTQVVQNASGLPIELMAGAAVLARTLTTDGQYSFSGLSPGAYQTRSRVIDLVADSSAVLTIVSSNLVARDTLSLVSRGDLFPVPNPVDTETFLYFNLPEPDSQWVEVRITAMSGDSVRTLLKAWRPHGINQVRWDGTNGLGATVDGGLYWATFKSGADERAQLLFKTGPVPMPIGRRVTEGLRPPGIEPRSPGRVWSLP